MTVRDLIAKLVELPQDLPVCIPDWNEQYRNPIEVSARGVVLAKNALYWPQGGHQEVQGSFICLVDD